MLIVATKLLTSAATLVFALGYAARRRSPFHHRRWMAAGLALALAAPLLVAVGEWTLDSHLRTGYWLIDLLGSRDTAQWLTLGHRVFYGTALFLLGVQAVLGSLGHPAHRLLARIVIPLWLLTWVGAMFFYY